MGAASARVGRAVQVQVGAVLWAPTCHQVQVGAVLWVVILCRRHADMVLAGGGRAVRAVQCGGVLWPLHRVLVRAVQCGVVLWPLH